MTNRTDKSLDETIVPLELVKLRKAIDEIDNEIIALLKKRSDVVSQVGEFKRKNETSGAPIRAGRESDIMRYIYKQFSGSKFNPAAATAIWRLIISASTHVESLVRVAVYAPDNQDRLFWLTREHFGGFTEVTRHPNTNRVVGDVVNGKAGVGILPGFGYEEGADWWITLSQQESDVPIIFAQVPFVGTKSELQRTSCFAIGKVEPEQTDDDISLVALHTSDISIHKLTSTFAAAGIKASRIQFVNNAPSGIVSHLMQIQGFVRPDDQRLARAIGQLGETVSAWKWLGTYAAPIIIQNT